MLFICFRLALIDEHYTEKLRVLSRHEPSKPAGIFRRLPSACQRLFTLSLCRSKQLVNQVRLFRLLFCVARLVFRALIKAGASWLSTCRIKKAETLILGLFAARFVLCLKYHSQRTFGCVASTSDKKRFLYLEKKALKIQENRLLLQISQVLNFLIYHLKSKKPTERPLLINLHFYN